MRILMVLTSYDQLGNTGRKTGFWLEEFAAPYFVFRDAGVELTLASPKGGQPPIDPKSDLPEFYNSGKPVAAVCHSPAVLHRVTYQGAPIVKGKRVTGFTNGEEEAVHLTNVVPFLVEDELKRLGGLYEKAADWQSFAIVDGRLITGQNPASSTAAAQALLKLLARKAA